MISCVDTSSAGRVAARRLICALYLLVFVMVPATRGSAQFRQYVGTLSYTMAQPAGDAKDFANGFSWLGFTVEGDWFLKTNLSTGFILGWQEIYKESNGDTFELDNGATTGRTYRHIGSLPLLARARYWTGRPGEPFHAFAGLGAGAYWMKQTADFGIYTADEDHWHFGVAPEVGVLMVTTGGIGWTLNARYNYPIATGDYLAGQSNSWS
jgi:hypothetical protein